MQIIHGGDQARDVVWSMRAGGKTVGLVPTMGALHDGHLSLVRQSVRTCDHTVATIFVNPTQFGPGEDLEKYPRTLEADCDLLRGAGVDVLFHPSAHQMYPDGFSTFVDPPEIARPLEGLHRPGHFRGVTTVVMKLFQFLPATHAFFGRKDYQQFKVIQAMVRDLSVGIEIVGGQTVREPDGLALSSRNRYLSHQDRQRALSLSSALAIAADLYAGGQRDAKVIERAMRERLADDVVAIDYAAVVDEATLSSIDRIDRPAIALIAAQVGGTRLIDNRLLDDPRSK